MSESQIKKNKIDFPLIMIGVFCALFSFICIKAAIIGSYFTAMVFYGVFFGATGLAVIYAGFFPPSNK